MVVNLCGEDVAVRLTEMRTSSTATVMWIVPSLTVLLLLEAGLLAKSIPARNWDGKDHSEILKDLVLNYKDHTRDPRANTGKYRPTKAIEEFHVTFVLHLAALLSGVQKV